MAIIDQKRAWHSGVIFGCTVDFEIVAHTWLKIFLGKLQIVTHKQIQVSVQVDVYRGDHTAESSLIDTSCLCFIREATLAVIDQQSIGSIVGDVKVLITVLIEISGGAAHPITGIAIATEAIMGNETFGSVAKKLVGLGYARVGCISVCCSLNQIEVEIAVSIDIEERPAGSNRLTDMSQSP